jgi:hypothetical protein
MTTTAKVATRILQTVTANPHMTLVEAAGQAAWASVQEVQGLGWTQREQLGMVATFAEVAADMHTAAETA